MRRPGVTVPLGRVWPDGRRQRTSMRELSRPSTLRESMLCLPREVPEHRHDPVGRLFREKVPAVLKLVQLMIRQRGLPPFEFLPSERNVLQAPEKERRLVGKGRAVVPDRA